MVANQPIERPQSPDFLINQLRDLQQRVDELTRQSKYPFSVSHGGTPDFTVLPNTDNSGAVVSVYDGAGTLVVATDPDTKYGLARPYAQVPMYPSQPGLVYSGAGAATPLWSGQLQQLNSCFYASWNFLVSSGGVTGLTGSTYAKLVDTVTGWTWTTPTVTLTTGIGSTGSLVNGPFAVQVPQASLGHFMTINLYGWVSANTGNSNAVAITPLAVLGADYALSQAYFAGTTSP
ncbi:hypothetical protein [Amycolatopsis sp. Hca4]|uniref:hypothetical protein n=1 Tax=Amycolatopsis sp. Hca4 TaxID=2742131 RepID=UPI0015906EE7|nr:hypothetical protein [Amycolatopsis sp. Hca4]QKV74529.1 hypothetical protein HUT10_12685 [Amycolatopsis sp. Hca4]